ncbi:hypothetical protein CTI12_AA135020 [Artemisia annua]|uniref:Reverse transcriptase domain, Reverse transcriptase zinc-binding domain protein n=1 Tax=Artemisia annua TaxID=35608 RepID=A0A2U1PLL7_ARTAN|nr:hypothetical protein CTI12_AA135020 [Artemisia annua]
MTRSCPIISHVFFADDSLFFLKSDPAECQNLVNILARYCSASRQNINFTKSSALFSPNTPEDLQQQLCSLLNIQRMDPKACYLGLPSVIGQNKNELFSFILDKVLYKMQCWKQKLLSQAGREILIKLVIQAIPSYAMQCYLLPKSFFDKLFTHIRRFFWHGDAHGKLALSHKFPFLIPAWKTSLFGIMKIKEIIMSARDIDKLCYSKKNV